MTIELLTPAEMTEVDRLTIARGDVVGYWLMRNAGAAVAAEILRRFPEARGVDVLCGPGANGGDGYVAARLLRQSGVGVRVWRDAAPRDGSDAARAAEDCPVDARPLADFTPQPGALIVDAFYGAGLSRPVQGAAAKAVRAAAGSGSRIVCVDLPSGVSGTSGAVLGDACRADVTVTFYRKKPGHLLYPGRAYCGELVVAEIGISEGALSQIKPVCWENDPTLWRAALPRPPVDAHKYSRGHAAVFSGGPARTGAARLAAMGAARAGAGAVTVLAPGGAMSVNAAHLTSVMLKRVDAPEDVSAFIADRKVRAAVLGPGYGVGEKLREMALAILETAGEGAALVLDADGITSFADAPASLFIAAGAAGAAALVLTPHEGEFGRLFGDLARGGALSKLDRARKAAGRCHGVVVYKGPDTVIAAPDGRAAINSNGTPWLATAGSGDVLAGMIAGLLAQGMPAWEAACAAVWMHAEAGKRFGPGLIADDLPGLLPPILAQLL